MSVSEVASPIQRPRRAALSSGQLFDRTGIAKAIAEAHAAGMAPDGLRNLALGLFRDALEAGRNRAREVLDATRGGLACAGNLSKLEDELIRALHAFAVTYLHPAPSAVAPTLVIAAVGGYGRATLAPGSDIDLLFLLPSDDDNWGKRVTESVLYLLWDLKQKVGHSTRSVDECLVQSRRDMTVRTALLEARFILGDEKLFANMYSRFDKEIVQHNPREFVVAKLAERDTRISKEGQSRYLVEPNVKEGKGGLRDLNSLFWIAKYVYRMREASDLVAAGLFTPRQYRRFLRCEEFLWLVRCHMHFLAGRPEEILSFDMQRPIAERLGYAGRGGLSASSVS
ncbi:MAG: nucleotidyltransferase domain-containing protein [Methylovirgula sp.]